MTFNLIVSNSTANFLQTANRNSECLLEKREPPRSDFRITIFKKALQQVIDPHETSPKLYRFANSWKGQVIRIIFNGIPPGVSLFLPNSIFLLTPDRVTSGRIRLIPSNERGEPAPAAASAITKLNEWVEVPIKSDEAVVNFEVVQSNESMTETATIPVAVAFVSNPAQNFPRLGRVAFRIAIAESLSGVWEVRDVSPPRNAFAINHISQSLLFPFVTNQMGLDTQVVISNTSLDPFGTATQSGPVWLHFYGKAVLLTPLPPIKSQPIPPGEQLVFTLSRGGNFGTPAIPKFQGYLIATAGFEYCHGVASIFGADGSMSQLYKATHMKSARTGYRPRR